MPVKEGQGLATDSPTDSQIEMFLAGSYVDGGAAGDRARTASTPVPASSCGSARWRRAVPGLPRASPDGQWMYAVSETTRADHAVFGVSPGQTNMPGTVWSLRVEADQLTLGREPPDAGRAADPPHACIRPAAGWWCRTTAAIPDAGSVAVFELRADGSLGELTALAQHHGERAGRRAADLRARALDRLHAVRQRAGRGRPRR